MSITDFVKLNRETYNKIAGFFRDTRQYVWDDMLVFKPYLHNQMSVLDIGCGTGRLYQLFTDFQGVEYLGVDQSEEQINMAKKDFPNNKYLLAEMTSLPLSDKKFDFVFCIATLHHLPDEVSRIKALEEIKRVLKPGGYLFLTNWNMYSESAQKFIAKGKSVRAEAGGFIVSWSNPHGEKIGDRYYYGFKLEELTGLLKNNGFEVLKNYFSKRGKETNQETGANLVTIAKV